MKNIFTSFVILFASYQFAVAQCTPNPYTGNHGFILPDSANFPHTQVNIPFHANIQIQVAHDTIGNFTVPIGGNPTSVPGTFVFDSVTIHSVTTNPALPAGVTLQYTCNPTNCKFLGGNTGCIDVNVSAITTVGIYRIYVAAVAKGTFTPTSLPFAFPNQTIAQTVDRYKIIVDPTGTYIGEFDGDEKEFHFLEVQQNNSNATANLKFYSPNSLMSKIVITDIQGKIIATENTSTLKGINTKTIDLAMLSGGIYLVSIQNSNLTFNKKIVVTK